MKSLAILTTIAIILVVIGVFLWILGSMGRAVGGRKLLLTGISPPQAHDP